MQAKMVIFGMQVDDDLYRGFENQHSPAYSSLVCPIFFHSVVRKMTFVVKDCLQPWKL